MYLHSENSENIAFSARPECLPQPRRRRTYRRVKSEN